MLSWKSYKISLVIFLFNKWPSNCRGSVSLNGEDLNSPKIISRLKQVEFSYAHPFRLLHTRTKKEERSRGKGGERGGGGGIERCWGIPRDDSLVFEIWILHEFIFNCWQTKEMEVDRKFPGKYCFEFYSIRKSRIQENGAVRRTARGFSRGIQWRIPRRDANLRDPSGISRTFSSWRLRAALNFGARQTVKLKYRSALSKYFGR